MEKTPRGSIHTNLYNDEAERNSKTSGLTYMGIRPPGSIGGPVAHNKIRVVIRMRPFLDGET